MAAWLLATVFLMLPLQAQLVEEHDVKAAYLYNFTRFVEWPDGVPGNTEPFRLCVVADGTTTAAIRRTMEGESVNDRAAETVVPKSSEDVQRCQVLFVGRTEMKRAAPLLTAVRDLPVLTVGDARGFLALGGAIEFVLHEGRVRFDVNIEVAKRSRLVISARLLQVARSVEGNRL